MILIRLLSRIKIYDRSRRRAEAEEQLMNDILVLALTGHLAYSFVDELLRLDFESYADVEILPSLTKLLICNVHFSYKLESRTFADLLLRLLMHREGKYGNVPYISLLHCHITPTQLASLDNLYGGYSVIMSGEPDTLGVHVIGEDAWEL